MKYFLSVMVFMAMVSFSKAQEYNSSIGLRLGPLSGISYKKNLRSDLYIEFIGSLRLNGFINNQFGSNLTALVEYQRDFNGLMGLSWFVGGGAHVGLWSGSGSNTYFIEDRLHFLIGIDAIVGLEYVFDDIPLALSLDYKPSFNFIEYFGPWFDEVALTIRYLIN